MKKLALCIFLLSSTVMAEPVPHPMPWVQLTELYYSTLQVRAWGPNTAADPQPWNGVWLGINVPSSYPPSPTLPGVWYTVDLTPLGVAPDAKAAFLSGLLIITHGRANEIADLHITFARPDDATANCAKYIGQVIETELEGGQRSTMATWVPLTGGKFKYCYTIANSGVWPAVSAYGVNLTVQAWGR